MSHNITVNDDVGGGPRDKDNLEFEDEEDEYHSYADEN